MPDYPAVPDPDQPIASFDEVLRAAIQPKGSRAVDAALAQTPVRAAEAIASITDDRLLAAMVRQIFVAGFSACLVDARWSAMERACAHFEPAFCASIGDPHIQGLIQDADIIRNRVKIEGVRTNARRVLDLQRCGGSAAAAIARWPACDHIGLLSLLQDRGARLGGDSGPRYLRAIGKPSFILTRDVCAGTGEPSDY